MMYYLFLMITGIEICARCVQVSDGYPCKSCIAREAHVEKLFGPCLLVAAAGIVGMSFALSRYPPLKVSWLSVCAWPAIVLLPVPIGFVFVHWRRLPRYAALFRLDMYLITAASVMLGPYYFLNGFLDGRPPVAAQATVPHKSRNCCDVEWTLSRNGENIVQVSAVNPETFYNLQLDEAARIAVHPGAFSLPWFSSVGPWDKTH
jgi:hypothetical protein